MFSLILITPEQNHPDEYEVLMHLTRHYPVRIHVRKPAYTEKACRDYLTSFPENILSSFVIHEHHILSDYFPVKGVHLKEKDRQSVKDAPLTVPVISTSVHTAAEFRTLSSGFEYVFFSPLYTSISKEGYGTDKTSEELTTLRSEFKSYSSLPLIGLGGIHEHTIVPVIQSGFDGAALLGAVWNSDDPVRAFERIHSLVALNMPVE